MDAAKWYSHNFCRESEYISVFIPMHMLVSILDGPFGNWLAETSDVSWLPAVPKADTENKSSAFFPTKAQFSVL